MCEIDFSKLVTRMDQIIQFSRWEMEQRPDNIAATAMIAKPDTTGN